jgi:hypothetical protein
LTRDHRGHNPGALDRAVGEELRHGGGEGPTGHDSCHDSC